MADSVRIMPPTDPASTDQVGKAQAATDGGFGDTLATHLDAPPVRHPAHWADRQAGHSGHHPHGAIHAARAPHHVRAEKAASVIPALVQHALAQAMPLEQVPASWHAGLQFIVAQESAGRVGARNHVDTARGLFQLTRASYGLNPNGAASFGNAIEEAQGGIRYIRERYGTADNAAGFWRQRRWY